jgi:hypothetical protein
MNTTQGQPPLHDEESLLGLDVYSSDGQMVGRIAGYLEQAPEDERNFERATVDAVAPDGQAIGTRRLLVDGRGFPIQGEIAVPEDQIEIDLRGRRATLRLTVAQIDSLPRHDPNLSDSTAY